MARGRGGVAEGGGAAGGAGVGVVIGLAVTLVPPPVQLAATYTCRYKLCGLLARAKKRLIILIYLLTKSEYNLMFQEVDMTRQQ